MDGRDGWDRWDGRLARDGPPVGRAQVRAVLREHYGIAAGALVPLAGGLDLAAWTFRVAADPEPDLVLRLKRGEPRPAAYLAPRYLERAGVRGVVAPLTCRTGEPFLRAHGLIWSVYPFVDGVDGLGGRMTARHWQRLGAVLRAVHDAVPDRSLLDVLPRPGWDVAACDVLAERDRMVREPDGTPGVPADFATGWNRHRSTMAALLDQMRTLAECLPNPPAEVSVCHGDLHPGNLLIDGDRIHLLDWDDVLLAPRERDLIFVPYARPDADAVRSGRPATLAGSFLRGYHLPAEKIDWAALTYYRCERIVTDAIEWADQALGLTTDRAETRAQAAGWLRQGFVPGGYLDDAVIAAQHLPARLDVLSGRAGPVSPR